MTWLGRALCAIGLHDRAIKTIVSDEQTVGAVTRIQTTTHYSCSRCRKGDIL